MTKKNFMLFFLLVFFNVMLISYGGEKDLQDINCFLKDLQSQQESLAVQAFGVTEDGLDKVVRIHCATNFNKDTFLGFLKKYSYEKYYIDNIQGEKVFVVTFKEASKLNPYISGKEEEKDKKKIKCKRRPEVQLKTLGCSEFNEFVVLKGKLKSVGSKDILSPLAGKVSSVLVRKGDFVRAGTILASFSADENIIKLKKANEDKNKWEKKYAKRVKWKVRSPRAEKQAQAKIKDADLRIEAIRNVIENLNVKSGVDGVVKDAVAMDKKVESGEKLFTIIDDSKLKVLFAKDSSFLKDGYNSILTIKGKQYPAFVKNGSFVVDNIKRELSDGDLVKARVLKKASKEAIVISADYVMKDSKGNYVYLVEKKRAKKRYITVSDVEKGSFLVKEGLKEGDEIVATNLNCMKDNLKVKVMIWDNKTGKLRKRKSGEASLSSQVVETKQVYADGKQRVLKQRRRNANFSIFAGAVLSNFKEESVKDVYGSSMIPGGMLGFSYKIFKRYELFLAASYLQKTGKFTYFEEKTILTVLPIYAGLKVHITEIAGFTPYAGVAFVYFNVKEDTKHDKMEDLGVLNDKSISLLGGCYYDISSDLSAFVDLKYDIAKIKNEKSEIDFSGLRLSVGLQLKF